MFPKTSRLFGRVLLAFVILAGASCAAEAQQVHVVHPTSRPTVSSSALQPTLGPPIAAKLHWDATVLFNATVHWNEEVDRLAELDRQKAEKEAEARRRAQEAKKPPSASRPAAPADSGPVASGDIWWDLAGCESTWRNDTGDPFWGYFQFTLSTWHGLGESGYPSDYGYEYQKKVAQRNQARSGFASQWPACSRKLGLR